MREQSPLPQSNILCGPKGIHTNVEVFESLEAFQRVHLWKSCIDIRLTESFHRWVYTTRAFFPPTECPGDSQVLLSPLEYSLQRGTLRKRRETSHWIWPVRMSPHILHRDAMLEIRLESIHRDDLHWIFVISTMNIQMMILKNMNASLAFVVNIKIESKVHILFYKLSAWKPFCSRLSVILIDRLVLFA